MNTNTVIIIIIVILLAAGGIFYFTAQDAQAPEEGAMEETGDVMSEEGAMSDEDGSASGGMSEDSAGESMLADDERPGATVTYTEDGFTPASVTISAGEQVIFVNESGGEMWPASAMHPTHTVYPGSDIKKCSTEERDTLFDACDQVAVGESYTFVFTESGEWKYHDHLNPRSTGTIVVN